MTDALQPVVVPYARFLEVRARRHRIVAELAVPNPEGSTADVEPAAPMADEQEAAAVARPVATAPGGIPR